MLNRLILKVTKFQLPPPKHLGTVVKNILGAHDAHPPMSNRVNSGSDFIICTYVMNIEINLALLPGLPGLGKQSFCPPLSVTAKSLYTET